MGGYTIRAAQQKIVAQAMEETMDVLTYLRGKKTYSLVACALGVVALNLTGLLDDTATNMALAALGFGGLATLRAGIVNALAQAKAEAAAAQKPNPAPPAA